MKQGRSPYEEEDIILGLLQRVTMVCPTFTEEQKREVEIWGKQRYGGARHFVPKGKKHPTPEQREAVIKDGMTEMSTPAVIERHGIGRATLYRYLKRGTGG